MYATLAEALKRHGSRALSELEGVFGAFTYYQLGLARNGSSVLLCTGFEGSTAWNFPHHCKGPSSHLVQ